MQIDISQYTQKEFEVISEKIGNLGLNYYIQDKVLYFREQIDSNTFQYITDFSRV